MAIRIDVDVSKPSVAASYGIGDGKHENIRAGSLSEIDLIEKENIIKTYTAHYRFDFRKGDFIQKELVRIANENGKDEPLELPFVYDHTTADKILDYMRKDAIAAATQFKFTGFKNGVSLAKNDRINVKVPSIGLDSDWQILNHTKIEGLIELEVKRYLDNKYTYEPAASLPVDEVEPIPPDFEGTPPPPVSSLNVIGSVRLSEQVDRSGILDISYTPPDEGNYTGAEIFIKENGQGASSYKSYGVHFDGALIEALKPNTAYDVQVISIGEIASNRGLPIEDLNTTTGSSTSAPSTPSAPSVERSGRVWVFRGTEPFSAEPIKDAEWEVDPSSGPNYIVSNAQFSITHNEDGTTSRTARARFRVRNIYNQWSNWSSYSSTVSTEVWQQGHMGTDSIGNQQLQTNSVDRLNVQDAEIISAKIGALEVKVGNIASLSVNEFKRIGVEVVSRNFSFNSNPNNVVGTNLSFTNSSGTTPVVSLTFSSNHTGNSRLIASAYLIGIVGGIITSRVEIGDFGGSGGPLVSGGQTVYYW